jgi:hypothetical protein
MNRATFVALVALLALSGCAKTDLGQTCAMTKPKPAGGCPAGESSTGPTCPITWAEIEDQAGTKDIVALGSPVCDDLVCVHSAHSSGDPAADDKGNAQGYCTACCLTDADCDPDFQGNKGTMTCAQLLLSDAFMQQLKDNDPATYQKLFGDGACSHYCILPRDLP